MTPEIIPSLIIARIRRNKEKRIKSVFAIEEDGRLVLSVYLKEGQPLGRKSFNYFPYENEGIETIYTGIIRTLDEIMERGDKPIEFNAEEEYDSGG